MASENFKLYDNDGNEIDTTKLFIDPSTIQPMSEDRKRKLLKGKRSATISLQQDDIVMIEHSEN